MKSLPAPFADTPFAARVRVAEPLSRHTTLGVGGPADWFFEATTAEELTAALAAARERAIPVTVLAGGSNVVVADEGWPGLALAPRLMDFSYRQTSAGATLLCLGAGVVWDDVVRFAVAHELAGIEAISGVPGWVGAAPIQNIGCYGQEVSETVRAVEAVEVSTGVRRRFTNDECGFRYRRSVFKNGERGRYVVTRVELALRSSPVGEVRYDEVIKVLGGTTASLGRIREAVLAIRRRKSMVLDAADPNSRSVGSFFLNPLISTAVYAEVATRAGAAGLGPVPHWPVDGGQVKLSAAWLIEATGFSRGWRLGRVSLSDRHVLAIVNRGGATAADVVALARQLRGTVRHTFGITLEPEPTFVGFAASVDELLE